MSNTRERKMTFLDPFPRPFVPPEDGGALELDPDVVKACTQLIRSNRAIPRLVWAAYFHGAAYTARVGWEEMGSPQGSGLQLLLTTYGTIACLVEDHGARVLPLGDEAEQDIADLEKALSEILGAKGT